jgi:hypothetical protein
MTYGNQHASRYGDLMHLLYFARTCLQWRDLDGARECLAQYRTEYDKAPASTRRRWKCGR